MADSRADASTQTEPGAGARALSSSSSSAPELGTRPGEELGATVGRLWYQFASGQDRHMTSAIGKDCRAAQALRDFMLPTIANALGQITEDELASAGMCVDQSLPSVRTGQDFYNPDITVTCREESAGVGFRLTEMHFMRPAVWMNGTVAMANLLDILYNRKPCALDGCVKVRGVQGRWDPGLGECYLGSIVLECSFFAALPPEITFGDDFNSGLLGNF